MNHRNSVVSPRFEEESYKGQDVVHEGVRIPLHKNVEQIFAKFSAKARQKINTKVGFLYRNMEDGDLPTLRKMWFDENDDTFPVSMYGHIGIVACSGDGEVLAGAIWSRQGSNLFLHQLVSGDKGRDAHAPYKLIWQSVIKFVGEYHSLDIGVSYNPKRYQFFRNFAVETYPIILKKPFYVPVIRLSPFRYMQELMMESSEKDVGENVTFLPRGTYAMYAALKHIGVGKGDQVCIVKTFGSDFISGCVTQTIEKTGAQWKLRDLLRQGTKAVVVIHEFGIPVFQEKDIELIERARYLGIPVIEDCAWRWQRVFSWSDYIIFSSQKMFNMNYGGLLVGAKIPDEKLWEWGCLDVVKRERYMRETKSIGWDQRKANWQRYHDLVLADGMTPDDCYEYQAAVWGNHWVPTVYMQKFESDVVANAIVERLEEFGIQAGRYWGESVVYLPIHQSMSIEEVEYMFAVVRGYFNMCRDYR